MLKNIKTLKKSKFIRSVVVVATGTAGAQAISMIFAPIITRLYGPEAFGLLGTFVAIVAVLTPMAALTYPIAIVLPEKDRDAIGLVKLSACLAVAISSLVMFIIFIWGKSLANALNSPEVAQYLLLIPIAMFFAALYQIAEQWLIRQKHFNVMARVSVIQSGIINITKVGIGLAYPLGGALIIVQALAQGLSAFLLWLGTKKSKSQQIELKNESNLSLRELAYRHRDFPLFRAPQVTINAAAQGLPVLMLASLFGPVSAGFYTLGRTMMGIPSALIGKAVGDIFYPRISEAANSGEKLYPLVKKATLLMATVGFIPFTIVIIFGPWLFTMVFGHEWTVAGEYARWLAIWMFFLFSNNPSVKVIPVVDAQAFQLLFTVFTTSMRLLALLLAYILFKSDISAVIAFSIVGALVNILLILLIFNKCKKFDRLRV